jgi:hypothetical protein
VELPLLVIDVLLAPANVPTRRLQMPSLIRANPNVGPSRGNSERPNAFQLLDIANQAARRIGIDKASAARHAVNSVLVSARIAEMRPPGQFLRRDRQHKSHHELCSFQVQVVKAKTMPLPCMQAGEADGQAVINVRLLA